jgi:hypothetical protein
MKKLTCLIVLVCATWVSIAAHANCIYQGRSYATGTKIASLTCQADGSWR